VVVVLFALPDPGTDWSPGIPSPVLKLALVGAVISVWIRFRVFGSSDRGTK